MRNRRAAGFTLVEVLVVLGILICLMGILLPAITHMREEAKRMECVSNVRQLTVAWLTYAGDNERHICDTADWIGPAKGRLGLESGLLWPYVKDDAMFRCPDDRTTSDDSPNRSSFQINSLLPTKLDALHPAAKTFVFIEGCSLGSPPGNLSLPNGFNAPIYPQFTFKAGGYPGGNHKGGSLADVGTSISFADGHAIYWKYSDPRTGNILEALRAGFVGSKGDIAPNSPDVYQLEAWSGGPVPLGVNQ